MYYFCNEKEVGKKDGMYSSALTLPYCGDIHALLQNNLKVTFGSKVDGKLVFSIFGVWKLVVREIKSSKNGQNYI